MPLSKCPRCETLYNKTEDTVVCGECLSDEDQDYETVRETLEEKPDLNAQQVAEISGVSVDCVLRMIDSGVIVSEATLSGQNIRCGRCGGKAISATKRLCQACLEKLNREVSRTQKSIKIASKKKAEIGLASGGNVRSSIEDKRRG